MSASSGPATTPAVCECPTIHRCRQLGCEKLRALGTRPVAPAVCEKVPHSKMNGGYLHAEDDDSPYDVDGVLYCGRCHWACNQDTRRCERPAPVPLPFGAPTPSPQREALPADYEAVIRECLSVCAARGWSLHWTARGAYLHLEASELIEAWRGKGKSTVAEEAGDVLLVLFSILGAANVQWADALACARAKIDDLKTRPRYAGEEYSAATPAPRDA